jgi:hypothetical protein
MSKKSSALALAAAFTIGISACGGGGGSSSSSGSVSGVTTEGPVSGGTITVLNSSGSTCATTTTDSSAGYSFSPSGCSYPLEVVLSGGSDLVHSSLGSNVTVPVTTMRSILASAGDTVANVSPLSTMMYYSIVGTSGTLQAAVAAGSVTAANISGSVSTAVTNVLSNFGFGLDSISGFNPMTTILSGDTLTTFVSASEATSETLRRIASAVDASSSAGNNSTLLGDLFKYYGQDITDGSVNGVSGFSFSSGVSVSVSSSPTGTSGSDSFSSMFSQNIFTVYSTLSDLQILDSTGSAHSAGSYIVSAVNTVKPSASASLTTLSNITLSETFAKTMQSACTAYTTAASTVGTTATGQDCTKIVSGVKITAGVSAVSAADAKLLASASGQAKFTSSVISTVAAAAQNVNTFVVDLSSMKLIDYPSNTATTLMPSTPSVSTSSVLSVSLPSTTTVSASNLSLLASSTTSASATPPVLSFTMTNLPTASGTASVTMTLLDGSDATWSSGERQISASLTIPWSSNGTTLTLTAPSTTMVTYYSASVGTAASATLTNTSIGSLLVTTAGSNQSSNNDVLQLRIAELFNVGTTSKNAALASALTSPSTAGSYYYSVNFSGITLAGKASASASGTASGFATVSGTFTAQ